MKTNVMKLMLALLFTAFSAGIFAQTNTDPVILTVGGEKVTKSEFLNVYNKNNLKKDVIDKKSLEEYLQLYINFKLKVKEAEALGMDTVSSFITELAGYRKQLAQPYLIDKDVNDKLLKEAYDRMLWDIRASHILIKVGINASPADTLKAYNTILALRKRIVEKGEDFGAVAVEKSDDLSARDQAASGTRPKVAGNKGDLGYFTAMDLIYPFETAAYNTKVGEVSMPVRTEYGYHLVKVIDRRPAMGKVNAAHILVVIPAGSTTADSAKYKAKIMEISDKIKAGATFEDMAKQYSDDKASAAKGGVIPAFGVNRMVPEFIVAISNMKKNDVSAPVQTMYGWHIIKLIDRKPINAFDSVKAELKAKIAKDSRANKSKEAMVEKVKAEYNFKQVPNALTDFYSAIDTVKAVTAPEKPSKKVNGKVPVLDAPKITGDSLYYGKLTDARINQLSKTMFTFGDKSYTQKDFVENLKTKITAKTKESTAILDKAYEQFVAVSAIDYLDSKLESKYPDFKSLMKEYRDGILLFELTDEMVWSKAVKDTTGLKAYYEQNKDNYKWEQRLDATIYTCSNADIAKATRKLVKKGKLSSDEILKAINKDSQLDLKIESGKYTKKENNVIDTIQWVTGLSKDIPSGKSVAFVNVKAVLPVQNKSLSEARGLITADYQTYLEKKWMEALKLKYPYKVNEDVLNSIK